MSRSFVAFAALLLASGALAAPAPQPRPFISGWGNPVDPDGDCKIKRDKGTLTIEMPGSDHDYNPLREQFNAPRLFLDRDLEGEFEMQVRVRIDCRLSDQSTVEGQSPHVSAGFLIIPSDNSPIHCFRKEFGVVRKGSGADGYFDMKKWNHVKLGGGMILENGWKGDPYLRLDRRNGDLHFYISSDGEQWKGLAQTVLVREKLKVGLAAYSTSTEASKVRFDQLKITWPRKKKR